MQEYVADQLDGRTEGAVIVTIEEGAVLAKIIGDCVAQLSAIELVVNDLIDSLLGRFGVPFQATTITCGFDVVGAPAPPSTFAGEGPIPQLEPSSDPTVAALAPPPAVIERAPTTSPSPAVRSSSLLPYPPPLPPPPPPFPLPPLAGSQDTVTPASEAGESRQALSGDGGGGGGCVGLVECFGGMLPLVFSALGGGFCALLCGAIGLHLYFRQRARRKQISLVEHVLTRCTTDDPASTSSRSCLSGRAHEADHHLQACGLPHHECSADEEVTESSSLVGYSDFVVPAPQAAWQKRAKERFTWVMASIGISVTPARAAGVTTGAVGKERCIRGGIIVPPVGSGTDGSGGDGSAASAEESEAHEDEIGSEDELESREAPRGALRSLRRGPSVKRVRWRGGRGGRF